MCFFHMQYEGGLKNTLGGVNFLFSLRNPIRKKMILVKEREVNEHILKASVLVILYFTAYWFQWGIEGNNFPLDCMCVTL